jgi:hypothetical protein
MIITKDSHLDHGLTSEHLKLLFERFGDRTEFFIETFTIPKPLPLLPSGLYGPLAGDPPVEDKDCEEICRGDREYESRVLKNGRARLQDKLTVIAGPEDDWKFARPTEDNPPGTGPSYEFMPFIVLYTAYGGPLAPKEYYDPSLKEHEEAASLAFWKQHALVYP